jgi:hypothetical protein
MENLVPRLVGGPEAKRLGIEGGWYGTKVSGTFVTGPSASLAACVEAIDRVPEPIKIIEAENDTPAKAPAAKSIYAANTQTRTAYQIGRRPGR